MSLANGRSYLAIPGPSVGPEDVLRAMHRTSLNIYQGELIDLTHSLIDDLRYIAQAKHQATRIAHGSGAVEAAAQVIASA